MAAVNFDPEKSFSALSEPQTNTEDEKKNYLVQQEPDADEVYTVAEQRKIIHKVDRRLLILMGLMQAVSFLDRANIANAAVAGMTKTLQLGVGTRYSIVLLVFFAPYIVLQFPASIAVRKLGPRWFLSTIVFLWGIVMICFAFAQKWTSLIPLRFLIGALEAGCFPSQYYLISSWYSRYDLYKRTSVFYLLGVLGSAVSGVLGLAFSKMDGLGNYSGWRWIFIMEGIITCLIGLAGYVFMVDFPDKAHKAWGSSRKMRAHTSPVALIVIDKMPSWKVSLGTSFLKPALDLKVWGFALLFLCTTMQSYSVGFFLPVILNSELKFSSAAAQGLSTPPYLIAMILMFIEGWLSDKLRIRSPVLYFNSCLSIVGLCLMAWATVPRVQYFGAILTTAGSSGNLPAVMVFQANNIRGSWKRAFCSASMIGFGGTGGIVGSLVFRSEDSPKYLPGIYACLTANGIILITTTTLVIYFITRNRLADRGLVVIENLPSFRYAI